jgi:hypothetical protein
MSLSLFSSVPWTLDQVDSVLRTHFGAEDDDYPHKDLHDPPDRSWMIVVAPGRRVTVIVGDDDISGLPDVIMHRVTSLLGAPPIRRLSIMFAEGRIRGEGWTYDPVHGERDTGYEVEQPDLELNTALWIGAVFARWWPVAFDDYAGDAWRAWPA